MELFDIAASAAAIAMLALLYGGIRGLVTGKTERKKAWMMIALAVITAFNLFMWVTMPPAPPP